MACLLLAGPSGSPKGHPIPLEPSWPDLTGASVGTRLTSRAAPGCPGPYQHIDPGEGVVGVVQGVEQLVHPVVGLAVSIETHAHRRAVGETPKLEATPGGDGFFQDTIF